MAKMKLRSKLSSKKAVYMLESCSYKDNFLLYSTKSSVKHKLPIRKRPIHCLKSKSLSLVILLNVKGVLTGVLLFEMIAVFTL
jgi:hypothetical protein